MIKKLLGGLAVVGLCAGAALYLSSCAQQAGPLSPDLGLLNASSTTAEKKLPTATITGPGSVSQTATVQFSIPMNASTINTSNVQVYQQSTDGLSETLIAYSVGYNAASMQAIITPSGGVWGTDARYHIIAGIGCQSVTGNQLDGNGNNIPESGEFDNEHGVFTFGAVPANFTNPAAVVIADSVTITANGFAGTLTPGSYLGSVPAVYSYVTITVNLALVGGTSDPNFLFDSGSYFQDATTLHSNVRITDINGTVLTPVQVVVYGAQNQSLQIVLSLQPGTKYLVGLKGGINGIRTPLALGTMAIVKGLRFDGNNNGIAEASDDWKTATIMTANVDNSALPRLTVSGLATYSDTLRRFAITFNITTGVGTGTLDPATVNNSTFVLIDTDDYDAGGDEPNKPIIPTSIELDNSTPSAPVVYVYIPYKFSTDTGDNHRHIVELIVSPNVKTAEGLPLDTTNDGVNGQPNDAYTQSFNETANIRNMQQ